MAQPVEDLLTEIDQLSGDELQKVKARILLREQEMPPTRTAEEWATLLRIFLDTFWGDTP